MDGWGCHDKRLHLIWEEASVGYILIQALMCLVRCILFSSHLGLCYNIARHKGEYLLVGSRQAGQHEIIVSSLFVLII